MLRGYQNQKGDEEDDHEDIQTGNSLVRRKSKSGACGRGCFKGLDQWGGGQCAGLQWGWGDAGRREHIGLDPG